MTPKHFKALAEALRAARPHMPRERFLDLLYAVAAICVSCNPSFRLSRFFYSVMKD